MELVEIKELAVQVEKLEKEWTDYPVMQRTEIVAGLKEAIREAEALNIYHSNDGLSHHFGDGTYGREMVVPRGVAMIGMTYKEEQVNILLKGKVFMVDVDSAKIVEGPCVMVSKAGTCKTGVVIEEMHWVTVMSRDNSNTDTESILRTHGIREEDEIWNNSRQRQ